MICVILMGRNKEVFVWWSTVIFHKHKKMLGWVERISKTIFLNHDGDNSGFNVGSKNLLIFNLNDGNWWLLYGQLNVFAMMFQRIPIIFKKYFWGRYSFLWGYRTPVLGICDGFQSFVIFMWWIPQIHLWCNTSLPNSWQPSPIYPLTFLIYDSNLCGSVR